MNFSQLFRLITASGVLLTTATIPVQAATVFYGTFENGDFSGFDTSGVASVEDGTFGVSPVQGNFQGLLENSSGATPSVLPPFAGSDLEDFLYGGDAAAFDQSNLVEGSAVKRNFTVAAGDTLTFSANFLTDEATDGTGNNDVAFLSVDDNDGTESLIELFSVDSSSFSASGSSFAVETGYQLFENVFTFPTAGTYTVGVGVADGDADFAGESAVLVDVAVPFEMEGTMGLGLLGAFLWYRSRKKRQQA